MPRYIDASEFRKRIDRYPPDIRDIAKKELRYTPTADVVEVVRCRDCKHRPIKGDGNIVYAPNDINGWDDETCPCICEDCYYNWMPEDDFFCKRGERRNDE